MSRNLRSAIILGLAVLGGTLCVVILRRSSRGKVHAIDAVPSNAFLVLTIDVDALRRSPLGTPIFGGVSSRLAGEKVLTDLCGFDPLARMSEMAVAVPEDGAKGDFGISIKADVSRDELLGCARKVVESRKTHSLATPTIRESGSYTLVEPDEPNSKDSVYAYPTLAYREGGPFLIARGVWLASMIDTVEGKLPSAKENVDHAALRKEVVGPTAKNPGGPAEMAVVATAVLPKAFRDRVKSTMGLDEAGEETLEPDVMASVLGVASIGLGVEAGTRDGYSDVVVVFRCETTDGCADVEKLLAKQRARWSKNVSLRLLGLGKLLDSATIDNQGTVLRVRARASTDEASQALDRVLAIRTGRHPSPGPLIPRTADPGSSSNPVPHPPSPDELVKPAPTGQIDPRTLDPAANPP